MTLKYKINHEMGTKYIWFFDTAKEAEKEIEALGAKSLDYIKFYDDRDKLVETYSSIYTPEAKIEIANQFKKGASYCLFVRTIRTYA